MSTIQSPTRIFEEIARLFASMPTDEQILDFSPSAEVVDRASELLVVNRNGQMDEVQRSELEQFEQAELLMRMIKARIRARRGLDQQKS